MRQQPAQVARGTERPFVADANEIDATRRIFLLQALERCPHVNAFRQTLGERLLVERILRGEQQRLEQPKLLRSGLGCVLVVGNDHALLGRTRHPLCLPACYLSTSAGGPPSDRAAPSPRLRT